VEEVFNQGNLSLADEFFSPDLVEREERPPGVPHHREGVKQLAALFRILPDFKATLAACRRVVTLRQAGL
jgi:hypothetical protein